MTDNKNRLLLLVVLVLAVAAIYYGPGRQEPSTIDKMLDARAEHDHENALLYATQLLKIDPSNSAAKTVLKESGQIFFYLLAAKSTLTESKASGDNEIIEPEPLYEVFNEAAGYVAKAKALDPEFKDTLTFEKALNKTQTALVYILAMNVVEVGKNTVSAATAKYEKSAEFINAAASSGYMSRMLSIQSSWAATRVPHQEDQEELGSSLDRMDDIGQLVSDSKAQNSQDFVKSLLNYISITRNTVETLLVPKGTFNDYTTAATSASREYKKGQNQLRRAVPKSISVEESYANLIDDSDKYKIFKDDSIAEILSANEALFSL
jgi:hypothetical protein